MAKKKKKKTGTARMRQLGHVSVILWLNPAQVADLDFVRGGSPRASFAKHLLGLQITQIRQYEKAR